MRVTASLAAMVALVAGGSAAHAQPAGPLADQPWETLDTNTSAVTYRVLPPEPVGGSPNLGRIVVLTEFAQDTSIAGTTMRSVLEVDEINCSTLEYRILQASSYTGPTATGQATDHGGDGRWGPSPQGSTSRLVAERACR